MQELPLTVDALIDALDKAYPHRCAKLGEGPEDIFYRAGQRSVVDLLLRLKEAAEEEHPQIISSD